MYFFLKHFHQPSNLCPLIDSKTREEHWSIAARFGGIFFSFIEDWQLRLEMIQIYALCVFVILITGLWNKCRFPNADVNSMNVFVIKKYLWQTKLFSDVFGQILHSAGWVNRTCKLYLKSISKQKSDLCM